MKNNKKLTTINISIERSLEDNLRTKEEKDELIAEGTLAIQKVRESMQENKLGRYDINSVIGIDRLLTKMQEELTYFYIV